jgi:hypothetical protein
VGSLLAKRMMVASKRHFVYLVPFNCHLELDVVGLEAVAMLTKRHLTAPVILEFKN